jgi:hypothetical protein
MRILLALISVLLIVAGAGLYRTFQVEPPGPVVDNSKYNLVVCFGQGDKLTYGGLAEEVRVRVEGVFFTDPFGLKHFSSGVCVVTEGTQAQFAAQAESAAQGEASTVEATNEGEE